MNEIIGGNFQSFFHFFSKITALCILTVFKIILMAEVLRGLIGMIDLNEEVNKNS